MPLTRSTTRLHAVYFNAFAGGEHNDIAELARDLQPASLISEVRRCDRELFACLDGCHSVAHATNEQLHGSFLRSNCVRSLDASPSEFRKSEITCVRT